MRRSSLVLLAAAVFLKASVHGQVPDPPAVSARPAGGTVPAPAPAEPSRPAPLYDAGGRRDPFVSLLRREAENVRTVVREPRPPGLAGVRVDEVVLTGTVVSRDGVIGILAGPDGTAYIVRSGARLLDGVVQAVVDDAVVILQQINDPLARPREREVRKGLRQTEEAK